LTALAGATEIDLVVTGNYTIVKLGKITPEVMVTIAGLVTIFRPLLKPLRVHHHWYCLALSHQRRILPRIMLWDNSLVELR
jgi:hypothetical protein